MRTLFTFKLQCKLFVNHVKLYNLSSCFFNTHLKVFPVLQSQSWKTQLLDILYYNPEGQYVNSVVEVKRVSDRVYHTT